MKKRLSDIALTEAETINLIQNGRPIVCNRSGLNSLLYLEHQCSFDKNGKIIYPKAGFKKLINIKPGIWNYYPKRTYMIMTRNIKRNRKKKQKNKLKRFIK